MMGRTHATSGAAAFMASVPLLHTVGVSITPAGLALGTVAAAGSAMLPDLDHPHASATRSLGPLTRLAGAITAAVSGGHRQGTHSLLGIAAFTAAGWAAGQANDLALGLWLAFLFALAAAAVRVRFSRATILHTTGCLIAATALVSSSLLTETPAALIATACGIGAAAHVLGDMLTREGCPLLWPWKHRFRLARLRTGGLVEQLVVGPAFAIAAVALALNYGPIIGNQ